MSTIYVYQFEPPEGSGNPEDFEEKMDLSKINNIKFDGVDYSDWPDMCDAYICSADYGTRELTQDELDILNEDRDFVYEKLIKSL